MTSIESTRAFAVDESTIGRDPSDDQAAPTTTIVRGGRLSRYVVLERLGEGGMGVVYEAYDPACDRRIALKVLWPGSTDQTRLVREARAMARLSHPNVVPIYDVGDHEGRVFFAMALVDGTTLDEWLAARPRSWPEIVRVFVQAARGLEAAHAAGLVHRDFKPSNVLVRATPHGDFDVLVGDFGVAFTATADTPDLDPRTERSDEQIVVADAVTRTGAIVGTPKYMAPEQHTGRSPDARADQFAFCLSLYEALYGQSPFPQRTYESLTLAKLGGKPREPPARTGIPDALWSIVQRGLAVDPKRRFPDMGAIVERLEATLRVRRRGPAILLAVAAGVGATLYVLGPAPDRACPEVSPVWDESARSAVLARFAASELPYAGDAAETVDRRLAASDAAWQRVHAEACAAGRVADHATTRCLDRSRAATVALVEALRAPDSATIERATAAVLALPDPQACVDDPAIADPVHAADVAALRGQLAGSEATAALGRVDDALHVASAVLERAEAQGDLTLVAEARLAIGRAQRLAGDDRAAVMSLRAASAAAGESGHDRVAAEAAIDLVALGAGGGHDDEDPFTWARHAEAALARLPASPILRSRLARNVGTAQEHRGEYEAAAASYRDALAVLDGSVPTPALELAEIHASLGNAAFHLGDYQHATREHTLARSLWEDALGREHPKVALALNGLGLDAHATGATADALELHAAALAIRERALGPDHPDVAGSLVNLASAHLALGDLDAATQEYERALELKQRAVGNDHPTLVPTLSNMGATAMQKGDYDRARELFARAAAILEAERGPDHPDLAVIWNNVGVALARSGDDAGAVAAYVRVYELEKRVLGADHPQLASTHHNLAKTLRDLGRLEEATHHYERALAMFESTEGAKGPNVVRTLIGFGELAMLGGKPEKARERFERAVAASDIEIVEGDRVTTTKARPALPNDGLAGVLRAEAEFGVARASRVLGDEARAVELAERARERFEVLGRDSDRARVVAWLAE